MPKAPETRDPTQPVTPRRPLALRLIFWLLVLWTVLGWLRFAQSLQNRDLILRLTSPGVYYYLLSAGLLWGLMSLPPLWGLTLRTAWARVATGVAAALYPALYWIERLVLWQDETSRANWSFMLALTVLWLAIAAWGLFSRRGRAYLQKSKVN
jgi:uncharacterized membrane protein